MHKMRNRIWKETSKMGKKNSIALYKKDKENAEGKYFWIGLSVLQKLELQERSKP